MTNFKLMQRASCLFEEGVPFVTATVVRAEKPTSAKPGDLALVMEDGTVEGFVGGECAQSSLRLQALESLRLKSSRTLVISPAKEVDLQPRSGEVHVINHCLSGGTLEILLEPVVPKPLLVVIGISPIAQALCELASAVGFSILSNPNLEQFPKNTEALVVASHGMDEERWIKKAFDSSIHYVALVASRKRAASVVSSMGLTESERSRLHSPAGLDIKAKTPNEVAISILAEVIASRESGEDVIPAVSDDLSTTEGVTAVDHVCGMKVAASETTLHLDWNSTRYYFCGSGCKAAFESNPLNFVSEHQ